MHKFTYTTFILSAKKSCYLPDRVDPQLMISRHSRGFIQSNTWNYHLGACQFAFMLPDNSPHGPEESSAIQFGSKYRELSSGHCLDRSDIEPQSITPPTFSFNRIRRMCYRRVEGW